MAEINDAYIRGRFGENLPQENIDNIRNAMQRYNNPWWESDDPLEVAMYQIFEDILLVDFSKFHEGLEKFVDRPGWTHEMRLNMEGLRREAKLGITRLKTGAEWDSEERAQKVRESIEMFEDYCKRTGKKYLAVDLSEDDGRDENGIDNPGYDGRPSD